MQRAQRMMKAGMQRTGIYHMAEAQLPYPSKALEPWVFNKIKNKGVRYSDEAIYRIIEYFLFVSAQYSFFSDAKLLNIPAAPYAQQL